MYQTSKDPMWKDEQGTNIPYNRTTSFERKAERHSNTLFKKSKSVNKELIELKEMIINLSNEVFEAFMIEKNSDKETKGNFTWYNFDRSIKVEVAIQDLIEFDDLTINAAKQKFDEFLSKEVTTKEDFTKEMVINAFQTKRNKKLDVRKVMDVVRYKNRTTNATFLEAAALVEQAIRRPKSKTYFRIFEKNKDGYQNIDLNFSNI